MFRTIKQQLKALCLGTENRALRFALDGFLRTSAAHRIGLTHPRRAHEAICGPLQAELGRVLSFASEFEGELYVRRFETEFARLCHRRYAVGTQSGTSALQLALAALNIGPGDEVITVPFTYIATALAISNTGAVPVFVDVDPATFNMDPQQISAAITPRTKAIIPVHLYGQMANMPEISRLAAAHGLKVIEDACQAFGAELHGHKAGSLGDVGCFSFSTSKNLSGFGSGGMVVSDDAKLMEKIRFLRNPEANGLELHRSRRTPCYLDPIQIAFIRAKLPLAYAWTERRRSLARHYRAALETAALDLPVEIAGARHSYYRFAIRTRRRNELMRWLEARGIRAGVPYSPCLHLTRTYSELRYREGAFPSSESAGRECLLLPVSQFLTEDEGDRVAGAVSSYFKQ